MKEIILRVDFPRPSPDVIRRYLAIEDLTSTVSDLLDEFGVLGAIPASVLMPVVPGKRVAGPAVTLRHIPENKTHSQLIHEESPVHWALKEARDIAKAGDVLVYEGNGRADISSAGHLATVFFKKKGLAATIVDCGVRDIDAIRKLEYPMWARGFTPITGKYRFETVEINGPIVCAGVAIRPGDLILADDTGVVVVPFDYIDKVLAEAERAEEKEKELVEAINRGVEGSELTKILPVNKW
jgi:4-hydroxy-4-methyl-2-oxoglutarate aldolase